MLHGAPKSLLEYIITKQAGYCGARDRVSRFCSGSVIDDTKMRRNFATSAALVLKRLGMRGGSSLTRATWQCPFNAGSLIAPPHTPFTADGSGVALGAILPFASWLAQEVRIKLAFSVLLAMSRRDA